jgi:hypothetical protein
MNAIRKTMCEEGHTPTSIINLRVLYRMEANITPASNRDVIRAILQRHEDVLFILASSTEFTCEFERRIVESAIRNDDVESVRLILRYFPYASFRDIIESAIINNQIAVLQCIIESKASQNTSRKPSMKLLGRFREIRAIEKSTLETVQFLYGYGFIKVYLTCSIKYGRYDIINWLLKENYIFDSRYIAQACIPGEPNTRMLRYLHSMGFPYTEKLIRHVNPKTGLQRNADAIEWVKANPDYDYSQDFSE